MTERRCSFGCGFLTSISNIELFFNIQLPNRPLGKAHPPCTLPTVPDAPPTAAPNSGLSQKDAAERLLLDGPNTLAEQHRTPFLLRLAGKFLNPLVLILIFASVVSFLTGEESQVAIIAVIVLASVIIEMVQEQRADNAIEQLRRQVALHANVRRDGQWTDLPAPELVVGDVVRLGAGDVVPADVTLIRCNNLLINESILTGESFPQEKSVQAGTDNVNLAFLGTQVLSGEGEGVVTATGKRTAMGKIAGSLYKEKPLTTFEQGMRSFERLMLKMTVILLLVVLVGQTLLHHPFTQSLLFAIALAVGLTPELLPIIVTVTLSRGALRMAEKGVIVKSLPAIQNLGSMDVLCTDKTGTLTENEIILERYEDSSAAENKDVLLYGLLGSMFQTAMKSPLEEAVLKHSGEVDVSAFAHIDNIPFDFARRRLSVAVMHGNERLLLTKGAPESVLDCCTAVRGRDGSDTPLDSVRTQLETRFATLSEQGFRVLAVALRPLADGEPMQPETERNLIFIGFMAFLDPPKQSAKTSLLRLGEQGIRIVILTGDNEHVTRHVCQSLELPIAGILNGSVVEELDDEALSERLLYTTIFARLNPDQKLRIIRLLRKNGSVVGYLGDGVNDAPSLHEADTGLSVENACDIARESADLILLHKDLHVLCDGVAEGRRTHSNVMKYLMMVTSSNLGNMVSVAIASVVLPFLPMLPVQILLNNLVYDLSQLPIAGDNVDAEQISTPRRWDISFLRRFMLVFGPVSSIGDLLTFLTLLFVIHASPAVFQSGWFMESLITQSLVVFVIRTRRLPFWKSKPALLLLAGSLASTAIALILPFTPLGSLFGLVAPPPLFLLLLVGLVGLYLFMVEMTKGMFFHRLARQTFNRHHRELAPMS